MDKNQWIVVMMVVAFVAVGIFMYTVLQTNKNDIDEELSEINQEHIFNIDEEISNIREGKKVEQEINKNNIVENLGTQVVNEAVDISEDIKIEPPQAVEKRVAPETGPGLVALIIASIIATFIFVVMYKKQEKKNSL